MSSFCLGCGNSLAEGERFCSICGRDSLVGVAVPRVDPAVAFGLPAENSGKAIFSLVCGFIFLFFPFSICAVIFGFLALSDIRRNPGRLKGKGLAIAGIVMGFLGVAFTIGIIGLGIYSVRTANKALKIASNENSAVGILRTLNTAEIAYSQAHPLAGYTCSLADLSGAWGIGKELASGKKNGYIFEVRDCVSAKTNSPIIKYRLVAYPALPGKPGAPAYCSDQSDVIRIARNGSAEDCLRNGVELSEREIVHPQN